MVSWLKSCFVKLLRRIVEQGIKKHLDAGEYAEALSITTSLIKLGDKDLVAQRLHSIALVGLDRFDEALEISEKYRLLNEDNGLTLSERWAAEFAKLKCRSLYGLRALEDLSQFAQQCRIQFPKATAFPAYGLLASMEHDHHVLDENCLLLLDQSCQAIDQPWEFLVLWSAHNWLGNNDRAATVAELALKRYPQDPGIIELSGPNRKKSLESGKSIRIDL